MNLLSLLIQAHQYELDLPLGTSMLRTQILNFLGSYSMTARTTFLGLGKTQWKRRIGYGGEMNSSLPFKRHFRIKGGMWDLHTKAERGPGGVEGTYIFVACFFTQLCRVNKEDTAAGVNRFVIAKIYLICPGFGRHLINHPICLLCFPAGLRINNIRDPSPVLLERAPMKASLRHFRVTPLAPHFYQWYDHLISS